MEKGEPRYRQRHKSRSRWKSLLAGAALGLGLLGSANPASAETRFFPHRPLPAYRAMGGAGDVVSDERIPANAALKSSRRNITFSARANPTSIGSSFDSIDKITDFDYMSDDSLSTTEKLQELLKRINNFRVDIDIHAGLEGYATFGDRWFGKYVAGVYGTLDYMTYMEGLDINLESTVFNLLTEQPRLELGREVEFFNANAHITGGAYFGYGKAFKAGKSYIAVGVRGNAVYAAWNPIYRIRFNKTIQSIDDIYTDPGSSKKGGGILLDVNATFKLNDPLFNTKVGMGLTDFGAVWYSDGQTERFAPRGMMGIMIHPFHRLNHDNLAIALDVEDIGTDTTTLQAGTSYELKIRSTSLIPQFGVIVNEPDIYTGSGNNIITAGGTFKAGSLRLTAALEHNITKQRNSLMFGLSTYF
ncbi:conjugal transfer protein TraF [Candidatus Woesearchaeota archaeon]|nr:conjugal transfer protein TraF [Candidatus Woesearchaeota archaeon]